MLVPVIVFSVWQDMGFIMATPTQSYSIGHFYPKFRGIFPRLKMMDYKKPWLKSFTAVLAFIVVSLKTLISPLQVELTPKPTLKLNSLFKFFLSVQTFSIPLLFRRAFIRASRRAESSFMGVILMSPKRLLTSFTVFVHSGLYHATILSWLSV